MAIIETINGLHLRYPLPDSVRSYLASLLDAHAAATTRILRLAQGETARIPISGEMYASEQCYLTKEEPAGVFESHRRYIDIQVIVQGAEWVYWAPIDALNATTAYNEDKDFILYQPIPDTSRLLLSPGLAAVFLPSDGHMPCIARHSPTVVYKTVVKIPV